MRLASDPQIPSATCPADPRKTCTGAVCIKISGRYGSISSVNRLYREASEAAVSTGGDLRLALMLAAAAES